ncbi:GGDEF domain-containing protein [Exilibacterium tricleocarpae]|uniref:diguanylate cyclase n=1 Tax=Exilibacterium tricleocarpae TaxID=2591008 RepID=A0A545U5Q8_9GAMM|nr:diguanylate cyclase [Exilibacterium tricleocarpae]TQV84801.1 GGDEF domain-containing protein [Exilibacterium tricleocarpae]
MTATSVWRVWAFFIAGMIGGVPVLAAPEPVSLRLELRGYSLAPYIEFLQDRTGALTFAQVSAESMRREYRRLDTTAGGFGFNQSAWWVRFSLHNPNPRSVTYLVRQDYPLIDQIALWEKTPAGQWRERRSGDQLPFWQRDIEHRDFLFVFEVPADSVATYYMRFASKGPINIGLFLYSPESLIQTLSVDQLLNGLFYGAYLVLIAYNLCIFFVVRDRVFLYYLAYLFFTVMNLAIHSGFAFQFLWPDNPDWGNRSVGVFAVLAMVSVLQFARSVLALRRHSAALDRLSRLAMVSFACALPAAWLLPYPQLIALIALLASATAVIVLWLVSLRVLSGDTSAIYFLLAWVALLVGIGCYLMKSFGLLPHNFFTQHSTQIGCLIEMVLLSLALGSRFRVFRIESRTDSLTQLFNRRQFNELLQSEFNRATRFNQPLALLLLDIDHFKQLNDQFGHAEGDKVLKRIGGILSHSVRKPALSFRFGGEEFAVILPRTNATDAAAVAERLRRRIAKEFDQYERITISVGLAALLPTDSGSIEGLLDAADTALYEAKAHGRNCVVCSPALQAV